MNTYLVAGNYRMESGLDNDGLIAFHKKKFFDHIEQLAASSKGEITVVNELELIGIAVVEATEEAAIILKKTGYTVNLNGKKQAI
jgi:hypothetical protein